MATVVQAPVRSSRGVPVRTALVGVAALGVLGTAVTVVLPATRLALASNATRVAIEVVGLSALLFAAAVLSVPSEEDARPSRNAFVCALVVLALANTVFAIWPAVADDRFAVDRGLALYPWMAARYLAGGLLLAAAADRTVSPLPRALAWSVGGLVLVEVVLIVSGPALPVPVVIGEDGRTVTVVAPVAHLLLQLGPTVMFAVGSVMAARVHRRGPGPGVYWLSVALLVLAFAQAHEILYPAMLGPVVTSADVLRVLAFALLTVGAGGQARRLYRLRARAVEVQQRDIAHQSVLVGQLTAYADSEQMFRQVVTHELATPLAAIRANGQLLGLAVQGEQPPAVRGALNSLEVESARLLSLLQRLDELRDLEVDELRCDLRPVRIRPLLVDACRFAEALPGMHRTTLASHDVRVQADPVRFGQLLRNLLANAVRFSPDRQPISVVTDLVQDGLRVTVTDRGPGVPAAERELVLHRGTRGSTATGTTGAGLGLYLAQRIAVGHGTELCIADGPGGRGTSVSVELELA